MPHSQRLCTALAALALSVPCLTAARAESPVPDAQAPAGPVFSLSDVTRFNLPYAAAQPTIDGMIGEDEWKHAAVLSGATPAFSNFAFGRDVTWFAMWDEEHLYLAARSHLRPGEKLRRFARDRFTPAVHSDDTIQFGIDLHGRNTRPDESPAVLHGSLTGAGAGYFRRHYPYLGKSLETWYPRPKTASRLTTKDDIQQWELELVLDRNDLDIPGHLAQQPGDAVGLLLARQLHDPEVLIHIPSATGPLSPEGYPQATLTRQQPYVQVRTLDGLLREHVNINLNIANPDLQQPAQVLVRVLVTAETVEGDTTSSQDVALEERTLTIPAGGAELFTLDRPLPAIDYQWTDTLRRYGQLRLEVIDAASDTAGGGGPGKGDAASSESDGVIYRTVLRFVPDDQQPYQTHVPDSAPFAVDCRYSPSTQTLWIAADVLDAQVERPQDISALAYKVVQDTTLVAEGTIRLIANDQFQSPVLLQNLRPGSAQLILRMLDASGETLARRELRFEKHDEPSQYRDWWNNTLGDVDRVLWPFTPLQVSTSSANGGASLDSVSCVLRTYQFDGIGLPRRIESNKGQVLAAPARLVVRINGVDYPMISSAPLRLIDVQDHVVRFEGQGRVAGLNVTTRGTVEQDGLVDLQLAFEPQYGPIEIDELRIEWPIDDTLGNRMTATGPGGHYAAGWAGNIPAGQGVVWDSQSDIGERASGMAIGSFVPSVWIGTEQRGLLWSADSDYGWVPLDGAPAHDIVRDGNTVTLRNFLISGANGDRPFRLSGVRTVNLQYNASPFKPMATGWRLNQRAGSGMFAGGKYKVNWDTGASGWSLLSPPTPDKRDWPQYYQFYKARADEIAKHGIYSPMHRTLLFTSNQLPLRGHGPIAAAPGLFAYFQPDWNSGGVERLAPTWQDYVTWLAHQQVSRGGAAQFHFDDANIYYHRDAVNGSAYRLYNGQTQPAADTSALREFARRMTAMMQEHGYYPAGVSAHATGSLPIKALPWFDAVADGELPRVDSIDAYPPQRMIAQGCPHNFGTAINFMPYVDPRWAAMHDAATVGGVNSPFDRPEFRHWGIGRAGVKFVPYWRNYPTVRRVGEGLVASLWLQPGTAVIGITNLGRDDAHHRLHPRDIDITLNLQELGAPAGLDDSQIRAAELIRDMRIDPQHHAHQPWFKAMPAVNMIDGYPVKLRPAGDVQIDPRTGRITGLPIHYHDTRFIVVAWSPTPPAESAIEGAFPRDAHDAAWWWWVNHPDVREVDNFAIDAPITLEEGNLAVQAWQREGRVLIKLMNLSDAPAEGLFRLDLNQLGVKVDPAQRLWQQFMQIYDLQDRQGSARQPLVYAGVWEGPAAMLQSLRAREPGAVLLDGHQGLLAAKLAAGDVRVISIDRD